LGVLLPTIALLLHPAEPTLSQPTISHLLSFATISPSSFKEAAGKLDAGTREILEVSIRQAVGNSSSSSSSSAIKPQISLRSF
jgi:HEAT repeat-containing protein 5